LKEQETSPFFTPFFFTGMRLNELLHLRLIDVNIDSQEIYIDKGKGGKDRIVPIHPQLSGILRGFIQERNRRRKESKWFLPEFIQINDCMKKYS